jgi:hypothetical protein
MSPSGQSETLLITKRPDEASGPTDEPLHLQDSRGHSMVAG